MEQRTMTARHHHSIQFPSDQIVRLKDSVYLGGQEIVRDFHNGIQPFSLRTLDTDELQAGLADAKKER